jgi:hypothetical protein
MGPNEVFIALVAIVGGLAFSTFFVWVIYKLIRTSIESRRDKSLGTDVVSMKDFIEYKLKTERRIQTLEAIVVDQDLIDMKKLESQREKSDEQAEEFSGKGLQNRLKN